MCEIFDVLYYTNFHHINSIKLISKFVIQTNDVIVFLKPSSTHFLVASVLFINLWGFWPKFARFVLIELYIFIQFYNKIDQFFLQFRKNLQ